MYTFTLPRLVGTRGIAESMVSEAASSFQSDETAIVYARAVMSAAPSFVDAFVDSLAERGVKVINVVGGSDDLLEKLLDSASTRENIRVRATSAANVEN